MTRLEGSGDYGQEASVSAERTVKPAPKRVTPNEAAVLAVLGPIGGDIDWHAYSFRPLSDETGLDVRVVRLACRSLARKGLASFERTLWSEDGDMMGAGYRATSLGRDHPASQAKGEPR